MVRDMLFDLRALSRPQSVGLSDPCNGVRLKQRLRDRTSTHPLSAPGHALSILRNRVSSNGGAAKESNLPTVGLQRPAGFEVRGFGDG
jgi:hypothetical protein